MKLFAREVPEVASGSVEIKAISRQPGVRTKIAVYSNQPGVDPVGSCVGQKGVRVESVTNELGGERVDIVPWSEDEKDFIKASLAPVEVISLKLDKNEKSAVAVVSEDQLSLAIGKEGQNVRLASQLTGWRIDVEGEKGTKEKEDDKKEEEKETKEMGTKETKEEKEDLKKENV